MAFFFGSEVFAGKAGAKKAQKERRYRKSADPIAPAKAVGPQLGVYPK